EETLWVELDALQGESLVSYSHDLALIGPGDNVQFVRQRAGLDDQAVITRRLERVGQPAIDSTAVMVYPRSLAVHDPVGSNDLGAQGVSDALVAQANTEEGNPGRESHHDFV